MRKGEFSTEWEIKRLRGPTRQQRKLCLMSSEFQALVIKESFDELMGNSARLPFIPPK